MKVLGQNIKPGRSYTLDLQVARTYDATKLSIPVIVQRGREAGSNVLFLAGMHGDEVTGMESLRRLLRMVQDRPVESGTIIVIPILNVFGFLTMERTMPDGRDLNRFFPGSPNGSLTSRLSNALVKQVLPSVDAVIDLHSGSRQRVNYPHVRYTKGNEKAYSLARVFDPSFILTSKPIKGSLRSYCHSKDIPYLILEGGTSATIDNDTLLATEHGLSNLLGHFGLWSEKPVSRNNPKHLIHSKWVRAPYSGLLNIQALNGRTCKKGEVLAYINDPYGRSEKPVRSPMDGYILAVNSTPAVNQGDPLFHIGQEGIND